MEVELMKKINIADKITKFLTESRTDRILEVLRGKKGATHITDLIGLSTNIDAACKYFFYKMNYLNLFQLSYKLASCQ